MEKINNRNFIGIELNPDYFKIASKRLGSSTETTTKKDL
jgi:DNA modification methylase